MADKIQLVRATTLSQSAVPLPISHLPVRAPLLLSYPAKVALGHLDHVNNLVVYLSPAVLESDNSHLLTPFDFTVSGMLLLKFCSVQCISLWANGEERKIHTHSRHIVTESKPLPGTQNMA